MVIRDGAWTLFDYDFKTGRQVWHLFDGEKDVFRTDYRVDDVMGINAECRNMAAPGWKGDYHLVASVPLNTAFDSGLAQAQAEGDDAFVRRFLNDSDNRAWRTKEGRL
ncbi:hypothetical protein ACQZ4Z_13015 [Agrobacterium vitis]|uniref:hypothetical protein n=1 Tax=Agrobacterium vitis TaxID=373 RepID=UPI001571872C|nr:hypothetical protein [Agrobacterium vitis]NSZ42835.1 hypothetical protein [Agrobacterium vitis]